MRQIRVKSWPGIKPQKRKPPSVPAADNDPEVWEDRSLPNCATHQLEHAVECPVCGFYTKELVQAIRGVRIYDAVCRKCHHEGRYAQKAK